MRGAAGIDLSAPFKRDNAILPDGTIEGLSLAAGEQLVVRDYYLPVTINTAMSMDNDSALRLMFSDDAWGSVISFAPEVVPSLGGSLVLERAATMDPNTLAGKTVKLFNWPGDMAADNRFSNILIDIPGLSYDASALYSTGEMTFALMDIPPGLGAAATGAGGLDGGSVSIAPDTGASVPEPAALSLLCTAALAMPRRRR
jgi:hypothetical protein